MLHSSLATPSLIESIHSLLAAASAEMAAHGYTNWMPPYPRERLAADVAAGVVYAVRDESERLVATFMLRTAPVRPYTDIAWQDAGAKAYYLNRLAVDPARLGQGIGRWCLEEIARLCAQAGVQAVRCDVLRDNARLRTFYERAGYEARGEREHSGWEFVVYELQTADG